MLRFVALVLAVTLIMTGCTRKYWYKEGVTAQEFERDAAEVEYEAHKATGSSNTTDLSSAIATDQRRNNIFSAGMRAKGYRLLTKEELERARGAPIGK